MICQYQTPEPGTWVSDRAAMCSGLLGTGIAFSKALAQPLHHLWTPNSIWICKILSVDVYCVRKFQKYLHIRLKIAA